jgi:hypothetical protein
MFRHTTIAIMTVAAIAAATTASADAPRLGQGFSQFSQTFADRANAVETLKRGQQAQNSRVTLRMNTRQGRQVSRAVAANRETLRQRGDIARHARLKPAYTKTLRNTGKKTVRFASQAEVRTYSVNRSMRPTKGAFKTRTRGAGGMTTRQAKAVNVSRNLQKRGKMAQAARRTTSSAKVAKMMKTARAANVTRAAKAAKVAKVAKATKLAKLAKTAKSLKAAKALTGGAGTMLAGSVLGTHIPDPIEAAAWTINTLKDPKNAPKAIAKLGKDAVKTVGEIGKTITNPKKLAQNTVKTVKAVGKVAEDVGKRVGFAFTNPGQAAKNTARDIGNAAKAVGCAIAGIFGGCH